MQREIRGCVGDNVFHDGKRQHQALASETVIPTNSELYRVPAQFFQGAVKVRTLGIELRRYKEVLRCPPCACTPGERHCGALKFRDNVSITQQAIAGVPEPGLLFAPALALLAGFHLRGRNRTRS